MNRNAMYRIHRLDIYETAVNRNQLLPHCLSLKEQKERYEFLKKGHELLLFMENKIDAEEKK